MNGAPIAHMPRYNRVETNSVAAPSMNEKRRPRGVGNDAGGHLEEDRADGEERVGSKGLGVAQSSIEQEECVNSKYKDVASVVSNVSRR